MISCLKICVVLILVTTITTSQIPVDRNVENSCDRKITCSECIQTNNCSWCMEPIMYKTRCFSRSLTIPHCKNEFQWNPKNELKLVSMRELSTVGSVGDEEKEQNVVQISPQIIDLKLRINEPHRVEWQYKEVEDFPLDVYFLMDLSKGIENDKEKLIKLGDLLARTLPNITSNFRLGMGSFVNEIVRMPAPIGSSLSEQLCETCDPAYAFKNHVALSANTTEFIEQLHNIAVSNHTDPFGGGLKAIMQAVVCPHQLKWRPNARRILVFSTNAVVLYGDDNNLNGPTPNDGQCHLNDTSGMYTQSTFQDYPSIVHINSKVTQYQVNVIFAVTRSQSNVYQSLSDQIAGSTTATLAEDSSNVLELIRYEYQKISTSVEMKDNSFSPVQLTYSVSNSWISPIQTNRYSGLKTGDVLNFAADIVVTECPQDKRDWKQKVEIYPVGVRQSLIVNIEMFCSCPSENSSVSETNPERNPCRPHNASLVNCSGRGICRNNICECYKRRHHDEIISGQYCECDNFSCERENGLLCSGHGTCSCSVCQCQPGWSGYACECRKGDETCIDWSL